jgi:Bacterial aa3 type cytochrome c oxidase subunit IV
MATGSTMANNGDEAGKPGIEHQETFEGFITATKWGVILVSLALILMAIFLV